MSTLFEDIMHEEVTMSVNDMIFHTQHHLFQLQNIASTIPCCPPDVVGQMLDPGKKWPLILKYNVSL